jgi:hypothetical protein
MVPLPTDKRWRKFVMQEAPTFNGLATRIMFARVKLLVARGDEESIAEAISAAHDFFARNEKIAGGDLKL